jgi:hypothetical protein
MAFRLLEFPQTALLGSIVLAGVELRRLVKSWFADKRIGATYSSTNRALISCKGHARLHCADQIHDFAHSWRIILAPC